MACPARRLGHQPAPLTYLLAACPVLLPDALTDQVASSPRHVPRQALRLVAGTVGRAQPVLGRQFLAAVAMDTLDLNAGPSDLPETYLRPSLTTAMCLADANAPQEAW